MVICGECGGRNESGATHCATCRALLAPGAAAPAIPPSAAEQHEPPPARSAPAVVGVLTEPTQRVAAGREAAFTLDVRNDGQTADHLRIEVMGEAAAWADVTPSTLDLSAGASATVAVRLRPPRDAGGSGRSVDFALAIRSTEHPDATAIELGVLEIEPAADAGAGASPDELARAGAAEAAGGVSAGRRRISPLAATIGAVALVAAAAGAVILAGAALGPGPSPAANAAATPAATPVPGATSAPAGSPTAAATLVPAEPSGSPGAAVAWWQDAYDAATARGLLLGAEVAEGTTDESLPYAEFTNGSVVQRVYDAYWLSGEIWRAWKALGGGPGAAPDLGYPASTVLGPSLAARRQLFDDGAIYWTAATGAHVVDGAVWAWWRTLVGERGGDVEQPAQAGLVDPLGHPTSDVRSDATGSWIELENGMLGVAVDGTGWACRYGAAASGFPSCAELGRAPASPTPLAATPAP